MKFFDFFYERISSLGWWESFMVINKVDTAWREMNELSHTILTVIWHDKYERCGRDSLTFIFTFTLSQDSFETYSQAWIWEYWWRGQFYELTIAGRAFYFFGTIKMMIRFAPFITFRFIWFVTLSNICVKTSEMRVRIKRRFLCYINMVKSTPGNFKFSEFYILYLSY